MKEISKVYILDNVKSVRSRLQLLLSSKEINVMEASKSTEFFNSFLQNNFKGNLIIMDIDLWDEDGFKVIEKIRDKNKNIPIIILTANNQREIFIKGIFKGATDYILKPFEDSLIKNKIDKVLNSYNNEKITEIGSKIIFNLPFFLQSEFIKSKKGKYSTSVMMTTLYKPVKLHSKEVEDDYLKLSENVFNKLKNIFWDTDIFTKYGSQSFIGIFPFAAKENVDTILNKVNECFIVLKKDNEMLKEYILCSVFITYPEEITQLKDVSEVDHVILKLIDKTKETIRLSKEASLNIKN